MDEDDTSTSWTDVETRVSYHEVRNWKVFSLHTLYDIQFLTSLSFMIFSVLMVLKDDLVKLIRAFITLQSK